MLWMLLGVFCRSHAQGIVTFDGSPHIAPSDEVAINYYSELDTVFTPIGGTGQFGRSGGQPALEGFPRNGTAYLVAAFTYSLSVSSLSGVPFGLVSVDLAEFSTLYQTPLTVHFVGYRSDNSIVTTDFVTDGIIDGAGPLADFQTFYFGPEFSGLTRVEIPTYGWSLDNLVVSVPEPSNCALLGLGLLVMGVWRLKRKREL